MNYYNVRFDDECAICKRSLQDPVQLPCRHVFCLSCITNWLDDHDVCPTCRHDVGIDFQLQINETVR